MCISYIEIYCSSGDLPFPSLFRKQMLPPPLPHLIQHLLPFPQKNRFPLKTQPTVTGCFPVTTPSYPCETNEDGKTSNDLDMSWWSVSPRIGVTTQPGVKVHRFERSTMRLMSRFLNACLHVAVLKMQILLFMKWNAKRKQQRVLFWIWALQICKLSADYATTPLQNILKAIHATQAHIDYSMRFLMSFLFLLLFSFTRGICALLILISKACILKILKCPDAAYAWTALARPKHFEPFIGRSTNSIPVYLLNLPACSKYQSNILNIVS